MWLCNRELKQMQAAVTLVLGPSINCIMYMLVSSLPGMYKTVTACNSLQYVYVFSSHMHYIVHVG